MIYLYICTQRLTDRPFIQVHVIAQRGQEGIATAVMFFITVAQLLC